jgi:predicted cupin superfamily sugar epimerase
LSVRASARGFGKEVAQPVEPAPPGAPHCVPAGDLFGAFVEEGEEEAYALVCCVVVPGFQWEEFSMPGKGELLARFAGSPEALREVERLCK